LRFNPQHPFEGLLHIIFHQASQFRIDRFYLLFVESNHKRHQAVGFFPVNLFSGDKTFSSHPNEEISQFISTLPYSCSDFRDCFWCGAEFDGNVCFLWRK
jgi:hypothetical protein